MLLEHRVDLQKVNNESKLQILVNAVANSDADVTTLLRLVGFNLIFKWLK